MALSIATKRKLYNKWLILIAILITGVLAAVGVACFFIGVASTSTPLVNTVADRYGAAFSGIVGTSITIIGLAFLVYAYRNQQQQAEFELINKLYENLLEDINSIQYRRKYQQRSSSPDNGQLFQGVEALYNYGADDDINPNSVLNHLNLILLTFRQILALVENSVHQDVHFQEIMRDKIYWLFLAKIYWPCDNIYHTHRRFLLRKDWGNPKALFFRYEKLALAALKALSDRKELSFSPGDSQRLTNLMESKCDAWEQYPFPEPKLVEKMIRSVLKESALAEVLLDKTERGSILQLRDQVYRFSHFFSEANKQADRSAR